MTRRQLTLAAALLLACLLAGCAVIEDVHFAVQPEFANLLPLAPGEAAGQTLTSRSAGLNGIELYLSPAQPADGELILYLLHQSGTEVAQSRLSLPLTPSPAGFYRFTFAPQSDSRQTDYVFRLENQTSGIIQIGYAAGERYLDGAASWAGQPQDAQLAFALRYAGLWWLRGQLREAANALVACALLGLLFVAPGWALLHGLWRGWRALRWPARVPLAAGLGLGLYPLLLSWSYWLGWQNAAGLSRLLPLVALVVLAWQNRLWFKRWLQPGGLRQCWQETFVPTDAAFLLLLLVLAYTRFAPLAQIDVPLFGDSVQHVMITQLIVDHNGLFSSWQPYTAIGTFTYHFGFHAASAAFHWLSGLSVVRSVLWVAQVLNLLAVWAMYPLAWQATRSSAAGFAAVLIAGLVTHVPQIYLNWGRDTQLIGQVVLIPLIVLAWALLDARKPDRRLLALTALAMSGLVFAHYRVAVFGVLFIGVALLLSLRPAGWKAPFIQVFWLGLGSGLLSSAWLGGLVAGRILRIFARLAAVPASQASSFHLNSNQLGDVTLYAPVWLWLLALFAFGWGLWRRERGVTLLGIWSGVVLLAANPNWLGLPGLGLISTFAVLIAAYIPLSVLVGAALSWLLQSAAVGRLLSRPLVKLALSMLLVLACAGLWGGARLNDIQVQSYAVVGRPDLRAFAWLQQNTPPDALIAVNAFLAFNNNVVVGADGGWWLPLLAGRQTILPPITYGFENGESAGFNQSTNALVTDLLSLGAATPQGAQLLLQSGVDYVYLGQRQGQVNNPTPMFDPAAMLASGFYRPIYHQDRVWIFEILAP